jgi:hypothetical protein
MHQTYIEMSHEILLNNYNVYDLFHQTLMQLLIICAHTLYVKLVHVKQMCINF